MRAWILSDLHATSFERPLSSLRDLSPAVPRADLAIVAGDVGDGIASSALWLAEQIRPHVRVLWVLGNHEYHGGAFHDSRDLARRRAAELNLTLLDDEVAIIGGVRFVGTTLWTDYNLYACGDANLRREHMVYARLYLGDHRNIDLEPGRMDRFLPRHAREQHLRSRVWLDTVLAKPFAGDTVVVSHHAPSPRSILPHHAGDPLTPAFVSDLDDLILARQPRYWIHGHTHAAFDYRIGATRVLCNARGYGRDSLRGFRRDLVINVGA